MDPILLYYPAQAFHRRLLILSLVHLMKIVPTLLYGNFIENRSSLLPALYPFFEGAN
jgi:hypothetical protein